MLMSRTSREQPGGICPRKPTRETPSGACKVSLGTNDRRDCARHESSRKPTSDERPLPTEQWLAVASSGRRTVDRAGRTRYALPRVQPQEGLRRSRRLRAGTNGRPRRKNAQLTAAGAAAKRPPTITAHGGRCCALASRRSAAKRRAPHGLCRSPRGQLVIGGGALAARWVGRGQTQRAARVGLTDHRTR